MKLMIWSPCCTARCRTVVCQLFK